MTTALRHPASTHWFFLVAPIVVAADVFAAFSARGEIDRLMEAGLLFDLAVLLPCLYWLCYRSGGKKVAIRAVALCCLGIWVAQKLVPEDEHNLMGYVAPLRYVGIAALVLIELWVVMALYRFVFKGGDSPSAVARIQAEADLPPWIAKLLVLEAMFWRRAWQAVKKRFGRE
ncbi:MAG: hypothetical protein K0M70_08240 [Arenimonas sp.]|uniref:hypothetical protein n=1 Tax=Arenimonas sp. TaxID=1872635 RepID=UPI0025BFB7F9|nr:hypothetical protein [Arenimonas sp.]MBW8367831.1 hypothetical protein [Arenimonas sp.]